MSDIANANKIHQIARDIFHQKTSIEEVADALTLDELDALRTDLERVGQATLTGAILVRQERLAEKYMRRSAKPN